MNRFYKDSKLKERLPEEVFKEVMGEFLKRKEKIKVYWPYFKKVLSEVSRRYFAEKNQKENKKYEKIPENIRELIGGIFK